MAEIKVLAHEIDGVELSYPEEVLLSVDNITSITLPNISASTLNGQLTSLAQRSYGWTCISIDEEAVVKSGNLSVTSKHEIHEGYIEHDGYITGEG